jgi:hypothetical protein
MTTINTKNNFPNLKDDFKKDTGLDAKEHMSDYINYFNARMTDINYQTNFQSYNVILNHIDALPDTIRLRIAEMIREHEVIKQLLKK